MNEIGETATSGYSAADEDQGDNSSSRIWCLKEMGYEMCSDDLLKDRGC